jgi:hypothetical protein
LFGPDNPVLVTFATIPSQFRNTAPQALGAVTDALADCGRSRALDRSYFRAHSRMAELLLVGPAAWVGVCGGEG